MSSTNKVTHHKTQLLSAVGNALLRGPDCQPVGVRGSPSTVVGGQHQHTHTANQQSLTVSPGGRNSAAATMISTRRPQRPLLLKQAKGTTWTCFTNTQGRPQGSGWGHLKKSQCQQLTRLHLGLHTTQWPPHNQPHNTAHKGPAHSARPNTCKDSLGGIQRLLIVMDTRCHTPGWGPYRWQHESLL